MLEAIANSLTMAAGVALSPLPIAAVMMMLLSARAGVTGPAFLAGWVAGILAVGLIVLSVPGIETEQGEPTELSGILRIVFGVLLLLLAIRQWTKRPASDAGPGTPKLLARLEGYGAAQAFMTGLLLSGVNPKNLLLTAAGAAAIDAALIDFAPQVLALLVFTAIASSSVAIPIVIHNSARERIEALFGVGKDWLIQNNTAITVVLFVVFGTLLIARGLRVLAA